MAIGTTRDYSSQHSIWMATADLSGGTGHPFWRRLNWILAKAGMEAVVDESCAPFYTRTATECGAGPGAALKELFLRLRGR